MPTDTYLNQAVIPTQRKIPAVSAHLPASLRLVGPIFDPDSVVLNQAAGGFSSVIEIASKQCLKVMASELNLEDWQRTISPSDLRTFLESSKGEFTDPAINRLLEVSPEIGFYNLQITFDADSIEFAPDHRVCVGYKAYATLEFVPPVSFAPGRPADSVIQTRLVLPEVTSPNGAALVGRATSRAISTVPWINLGTFDFSLCCDYTFDTDETLAQVAVFVQVASGRLKLDFPDGELKLLFARFFGAADDLIKQKLGRLRRVHLSPIISFVGREVPRTKVQEFDSFDVEVFHVGDKPQQALAIACNIESGCKGAIEDVQFFIGNNDYGVISDEHLIERVFKHKWAAGGFYRQLQLAVPFTTTYKGQQYDGTLQGTLELKSLDIVVLDTDSNSRTDYLRIGGSAAAIPQMIVISDGTILGPNESGNHRIDLGNPEITTWGLFTSLTLDQEYSSNSQLSQFQAQAHADAYQHIGRPFANTQLNGPPEVIYCRLEGVTKGIFILGIFPTIFV